MPGFKSEATAFVNGLDRSFLSDPVPSDLLIFAYQTYYERWQFGGSFYNARMQVSDRCDKASWQDLRVIGELIAWWKLSGVDDFIWQADKILFETHYDERLDRDEEVYIPSNSELSRIVSMIQHPTLHDYFRVGIWDAEAAQFYLDSGIDADIADSVRG